METQAGNDTETRVPLDLIVKNNDPHPLPVVSFDGKFPVNTLGLRNADVLLSGLINAHSASPVYIRVFTGRGSLISRAKEESVCWMDIELDSGNQLSLLLGVDDGGEVRVEQALLQNEKEGIPVRIQPKIRVAEKDQLVLSSGKKYPLSYLLELYGDKRSLLIRPMARQQEILAGKRSFWMGAVECIDRESGALTGKGNMYIFRQQ